MLDIEKLEKLSWLKYDDKEKISKDINSIMNYLSKLSEIDVEESEYNTDINFTDRNSGTENFVDTEAILANSHHPKINNSVVLQFKK